MFDLLPEMDAVSNVVEIEQLFEKGKTLQVQNDARLWPFSPFGGKARVLCRNTVVTRIFVEICVLLRC